MRIRTYRGNVKHVYRCAGSWGAPVVALLFFAVGSLLVFDRPSWFWLWGQDWMIIYRFLLPILLAMAFSARFPAASVLVALLTLIGQFSGFLPTMFGVIDLPTYFGLVAVFFFAAFNGKRPTLWLSVAGSVLAAALVGAMIADLGARDWQRASSTPWVIWGSYFGEAPQFLVLFLLAVVAGYALKTGRERSSLQAEKAEAEDARRQIELELARSEERNRISHELHDVLGHSLAVVIAQADGARYLAAQRPEAVPQALAEISLAARGALNDAQAVFEDTAENSPGLAELPDLLQTVRETGLPVDWLESGERRPLGLALQLALYRVAQESLTNVLKHGGTDARVEVALSWQEDHLTISIDSANGADPAGPSGGGYGISGMRQRTAGLGGSLLAEPTSTGFLVRAVFPIKELPAEQVVL